MGKIGDKFKEMFQWNAKDTEDTEDVEENDSGSEDIVDFLKDAYAAFLSFSWGHDHGVVIWRECYPMINANRRSEWAKEMEFLNDTGKAAKWEKMNITCYKTAQEEALWTVLFEVSSSVKRRGSYQRNQFQPDEADYTQEWRIQADSKKVDSIKRPEPMWKTQRDLEENDLNEVLFTETMSDIIARIEKLEKDAKDAEEKKKQMNKNSTDAESQTDTAVEK